MNNTNMKGKFQEYLKSIGMRKPLLDRSTEIYRFYRLVCPQNIKNIFVSERTQDGKRTYESLWFFSDNYMMEAKNFPNKNKDDFDIATMKKRIVYWGIIKEQYDFIKPTEKSRALLRIQLDTTVTAELRASEENCDCLRAIIEEYVMPNVKE